WATVWRLESAIGVYYAKQNCPLQNFEARLTLLLSTLVPERVLPVTAADPERGLLLTPDQGLVFGDVVAENDVDAWCRLVAAAMQLQRELAGHADELAAAGLTTLHPGNSAAYVRGRAAALAALPVDDPRHLAPGRAKALRAQDGLIRGWADEVSSLGLPIALVHNDLHEYNAFDATTGIRFFDFGDAVLAPPLTALLIPLNVLAGRLGAGNRDPRLVRVADAALEVWSDVTPMRQLRAALPAALRLGRIGRVESWLRVCASVSPAELAEYGASVPAWLIRVPQDPPIR
ncbi:MAG: hypothetical protein ABIZ07_10680, partial [Dermatophilaceae bacterium]